MKGGGEASDAGQAVARLLESAVRAGMFPGAVAAWTRPGDPDGAIRSVAVGRTAIGARGVPVSPDTVYDLASLTKPLATAALVSMALEEGGLTLDDPISFHLPETTGTWIARVPLRHLLTHTAGLPAWVPLYAIAPGPDHWIGPLVARGPEYEPGSAVVYSCPGFLLLGAIVERVLDAPLATLFSRRIAARLGLEDRIGYGPLPGRRIAGGSLRPEAELVQLRALGMPSGTVPGGEYPDDGNARFLGGAAGNSGLFGTAGAVVRLALEFLPDRKGTLLGREVRRLAVRDWTPTLEQSRGLGWQLAATPGCSAGPALSPRSFGHTGFTGTSVWVDPERGIAMALLANRNHPLFRGTNLHPVRRRFHALVAGGSAAESPPGGTGIAVRS